MSNKERIPKELREKEKVHDEFFEKVGVATAIQEFFETEQYKNIISESYQRLILSIESIKNGVPEEIKYYADTAWKIANYTEEIFEANVRIFLKYRLQCTIELLKEFSKGLPKELIQEDIILKSIKAENFEGLIKDTKEICETIENMYPLEYMCVVMA